MKSEPVFYGRSHLSSTMKLHTLVGLLMQRKHLHYQNNAQQAKKKVAKSTFSVVLYPIFSVYTQRCKDNHMAFLSPVDWKNPSATSCWDKTHNQATFSNRKRSQTIAQFILIAKGLQAIYLFRF